MSADCPHRLGAAWSPVVAAAVLVLGLGRDRGRRDGRRAAGGAGRCVVVGALAVVALVGHGRAPFLAAIGIALVDVVLLVGAR